MTRRFIVAAITILSVFSSASSRAEPIGGDPVVGNQGRELILRGEYEKGLEQLRRAHLLFPLDAGLRRDLAQGYAAYADRLLKQKSFERADENLVKAIELYPEETLFALLRGICNYNLKRYDVARYELERARSKKGDSVETLSVETLYYLGLVLYETDNRQEAMELWNQGLRLSPGRREIAELLDKARKETAVEAGMDRGHSSRFDLTHDPGVETTLALAILDVLESAANQVGAELGHFPEARVPVAVYRRDDFKAVTDSPDWSGGVYDGKIRLPFGAMKEITPQMRGVLFHEYAHVVVFDLTRGNCPLWLNEGIAEMFGRTQYNRPMAELGLAARKGAFADFRKLEAGFSGLSAPEAALAYQQSYAMVNHIVTTYGWHRVRQMLSGLGSGMNAGEAIAAALKDYSLTYDGLVQEWKEQMARGSGDR